MQNVKVKNMESSQPPFKAIPNQFIITTDEGEYFQSYDSLIAFKPACINPNAGVDGEVCSCINHDGNIVLDTKYWDYSTTTGKYRNQFLGEDKAETQKKIKSGEYVLADLNS